MDKNKELLHFQINYERKKYCIICKVEIHPFAYCCKRCKKLVDRVDMRRKPDKQARIRALQQAWDGNSFRCYFTHITLIEDDRTDPRYLTFDHRIPRKEDDIVIVSALINDMKSDMTEDEFKNMVCQLADHFRGEDFDESAFKLNCWKR
jgi:hypothetical protein